MAKQTNRKEALTSEQKLEHTFVSNTEYPYPIPDNWCWVTIQEINKYQSTTIDPAKYHDVLFELYSVPSSSNGYPEIVEGSEIGSSKQRVEEGDVLLCKINPRINRVWKVSRHTNNTLLASSEWIIIRNHEINTDYLMYCFRSPYFREYMMSSVAGVGGSLMRAQPKNVKMYPVPIPPFKEQQRIVDRIESLFAKLDEAKAKTQAVVDGYEDREASILYQAFSGQMTRKWAEHQGIPATAWCTKQFDEVADIKCNLVDPADYQDFPHIAPDNIEKKTGRLLEYHTIAEDGMKSGKHRFYPGQILYSKIRPNLSKVIVADFDGLCSADMYPIEPKEGINTKYLWYYMLSEEFLLQASTAGSRSVLPKINQKELSKLTVRVTDPLEQERIVSILDQLFEKEQQIKENAECSLEHIEFIKKSILARAFRGELGTNYPNDESAIELLRRILK